MKNWFSKELPAQPTTPFKNLDDAFRGLCADQGGRANGAAVFGQRGAIGDVVTLFFSPEAKRLAQTVGAEPCAKPTPQQRWSLDIGDGQSWEIHFPNYERAKPQESTASSPSAAAFKNRRREASNRA